MNEIDYYFWMNSDWAYLGADRLEQIAAEYQLKIRYMPVDLPDVYRRTGGQLLGNRAPERQAYRIVELKRWCKKLDIHVNPTPKFMCPNADAASRIVIAADRMGLNTVSLYKAILRAEWCDDRDISDREELKRILVEEGLDADRLLVAADAPEIEAFYRHFTDTAVEAGVFGSPSYVFNNELFWGQDRLDMLEDAITSAIGGAPRRSNSRLNADVRGGR
ncbi:2-hydroxychromene-2-carboxylate isomerase [Bradyrhizobium sp. Rc3b]|uniref:2-hydroxychromene-2-carboxylate isomerase n=1 Tax=Bradyrhizobium sp. Rc3b TaxID=1855322 RepID=UPI0008E71B62|nr:2-hydroxychromene-2-carboxylate isomerase [Bradyrhizobium sp. Rc3b]SFN83159.1 2-hydroxychromene-2-carboxylate isomerase [Bradyrhizobium sp. Rc3b]